MTQEIDELISLYLTGNATKADRHALHEWVNASQEHRDYYLREKNLYETAHPRFLPQDIDRDRALQQVLSRIHREPTISAPSVWQKYSLWTLSTGIAATVLLVLGLWSLLPRHSKEAGPHIQSTLSMQIHPEEASQAILVLESGKEIVLDNQLSSYIDDNDPTIRMNSSDGTMEYRNQTNNQQNATAMHELYTPKGKEFQVVLDDGTKVWLNADSHLKHPARFHSNERVVYLEGEAYFDVKSQQGTPFKVITTHSHISVLGTAFNVCDYKDDQRPQITLERGQVAVGSTDSPHEVTLLPGEQATIHTDGHTLSKRQVNTALYCGWKDGVMIFEQTPLEEIMRRISRWYGLYIEWENPELKSITFTGEMKKYDNLQSILQILGLTEEMRFECQDKRLIISKK